MATRGAQDACGTSRLGRPRFMSSKPSRFLSVTVTALLTALTVCAGLAVSHQPALSAAPSEGKLSTPAASVSKGDIQTRLRPEPDGLPLPNGCNLNQVVAIATGFVGAFNRGDTAALAGFIPAEPLRAEPVGPGKFGWLSVTGASDIARTRAEVVAYATLRHAHGERWRLLQLEVSGSWWDPGVDFLFDMDREADDLPLSHVGGKGVLNCGDGTIAVWNVGDREVLPDAWFVPSPPGAATPVG